MSAPASLSPPPKFAPSDRLRRYSPSGSYDCLVSQPPESAKDTRRGWPLILFLHGSGERGTILNDVVRQGLPRLLSGGPDLSAADLTIGDDVAARFVVVSPQCAPYEVWDEARLLTLLDQVGSQFNIDSTRVYLSGLSMGGFGAWSLGLRHPQRFAALVPICGGGRIADVSAALQQHPEALRSFGVWAFHGAMDRVVPVEESSRMIEALRQAGVPDVRFTIYPEAEHDAWTAAYATAELYPWLLTHHR